MLERREKKWSLDRTPFFSLSHLPPPFFSLYVEVDLEMRKLKFQIR